MEPRILVSQLLKGREVVADLGRMKFTLVRPSEMELIQMGGPTGQVDVGLVMLRDKCVGWSGVLESDISPGGASDEIPFDRVLYQNWIADRPDIWVPMLDKFGKAIDAHRKALEQLKGN